MSLAVTRLENKMERNDNQTTQRRGCLIMGKERTSLSTNNPLDASLKIKHQ